MYVPVLQACVIYVPVLQACVIYVPVLQACVIYVPVLQACVVCVLNYLMSYSTATEQETVKTRQEYATKKAEMLEKTRLVLTIVNILYCCIL